MDPRVEAIDVLSAVDPAEHGPIGNLILEDPTGPPIIVRGNIVMTIAVRSSPHL